MNEPLTIQCPAKVNLSLSVGPPRADGMHPLASWMVKVSLVDDLKVARVDGPSRFDVDWAENAPQPSPIDWPVSSDLIYRAHQLLEAHTGHPLPIIATLRKRIPVGAGLGGGSGDAAGMLRALDQLFDLRIPIEVLEHLSTRLGSDVPFFLGPGSSVVSGLGEICEPAPLDEPIYMTLILPKLRCDTAVVYREYDRLRPDAALRPLTAARKTEGILSNDLAEAAMTVEPRLRELRERCAWVAGKTPHITGSGAAMYMLHSKADEAAAMARRIREKCDVATIPVRTLAD